jgi:hypothetical protein
MPIPLHRLGIALGLAGALTACSAAQFEVKRDPDFSEGRTTVSVLGVYQAGRMNAERWNELRSPVGALLGQCDAAYGDDLHNADPALFTTIEESTRENGVTEELLTQVAPKAVGDLIMVLSVRGRLATAKVTAADAPASAPAATPSKRGGGPQGQHARVHGRPAEFNEFGMAATIYSVRLHRGVVRLDMTYAGTDIDEAVRSFVEKLGTILPGSTCRGWKWPTSTGVEGLP